MAGESARSIGRREVATLHRRASASLPRRGGAVRDNDIGTHVGAKKVMRVMLRRGRRAVDRLDSVVRVAFEGNEVVLEKWRVAAGREVARRFKVEHTIHNEDGEISEKNSYGNDAFPSRG